MDIVKYTDHEIIKNLALLENHLKQAQSGVDEIFCKDCINKHLVVLEGLSEEGFNAGDSEKYKKVYDFIKKTKDKDYRNRGINFSEKAREIRKSLTDDCPECEEKLGKKNFKAIKELTKTLNNTPPLNNQLNINQKKMPPIKQLGMYNAGQFAAEGVKYLAETQVPQYGNWLLIGGGAALQAVGAFVRMPEIAKTLSLVAGSNLLAYGVVKMIKGGGAATPARARAKVGGAMVRAPSSAKAGTSERTFGGQVTASQIPSQYARAGILKGAQAFEAPMHADLIRVD